MTLQHYVEQIMRPQTLGRLGSGLCDINIITHVHIWYVDTLYHFGDNDRGGWQDLFSLYRLPPYPIPGLKPVLSFGLAGHYNNDSWWISCIVSIIGPGTGVPFHIHGPTFAETIYGRKVHTIYVIVIYYPSSIRDGSCIHQMINLCMILVFLH